MKNSNNYIKKSIKILIIYFFFNSLMSFSQTITHGPVIGAISDSSARIYIRSNNSANVTIEISKQSNFSSINSYPGIISNYNDTSTIINLSGLEDETKYYFRIKLNNVLQQETGSFSTFPINGKKGNYVILAGSGSNLYLSDSLFRIMQNQNANIFLHYGDWTYPDTPITSPTYNDFFSYDSVEVAKSYRIRYGGFPNIKEFLKNCPIDYMYDDHDFVSNDACKNSTVYKTYDTLTHISNLYTVPFAPLARRNAIIGYDKYFPHYPLIDTTQGIYHKFKLGNAEFFVLDLRSSRSPNFESFIYNPNAPGTNKWSFEPPPGHTMLGASQLNWLLTNLQNSTADWKFIISTTTFNKSYDELLNLMMIFQNAGGANSEGTGSGLTAASGFADSWAGFPSDRDSIIEFIKQKDIQNVIVVSGDSHSSAIDDGTNSGLPEIMAANVNQINSHFVRYIDSIYTHSLWNRGGQGLGNTNYNFCFGKIEIFSDDSCRLSLVDVNDEVITSYTIPKTYSDIKVVNNPNEIKLFPNPVENLLSIKFLKPTTINKIEIIDISNRVVLTKEYNNSTLLNTNIDIKSLKEGVYLINIFGDKFNKKDIFIKQK